MNDGARPSGDPPNPRPVIRIHLLTPSDWHRFRHLRLRSLEDAPDAFGSTYESVARRPDSDWPRMVEEIPTFVAEVDGEDVGLVRCADDHTEADTAWLISMWVAPEVRGRGVGDRLVREVLEVAAKAGYAQVCLDVADHNDTAIALYERHGFEPTGEVTRMLPPREHITEHRRTRSLADKPPGAAL